MYLLTIIQQLGAAGAIAFLVSIVIAITFHEFAHAWTADLLGDDTPYHMGRVNLNPLSHLDPIGSLLFLVFGFGWGKPVIYNPMRLSRKVDELLIALAGPVSNLILSLVFNLLGFVMLHFNPSGAQFLFMASYVNILLAAFNMLPIPPLDGSSIVAYFWPGYRSLLSGQIGFIVLLAVIFLLGSVLALLITPVIHGFATATSLFGLLPNPLHVLPPSF